ncbi:MAG: histidine--tRNA ligase [Sporocytophaga sp.]|uniref:histidine--tRNA ligase n=1 Tax=Sporocytophaga sp. TaxID=2231183 RepID=UPI001B08F46B|nr:histidine--tRNA ligase [Sporocytophaga sp.]MBO9700859.1 histidine--tRNA ligase [Sporocytophaga sp.]
MSIQKPSIPKGTRDFGPEKMAKRNYIFSTIKEVFTRFGFLPLETPSMENISVLTGKYGDEGDQLIFKILNSRLYEAKNKEELKAEFDKGLEKNTNSDVLTEKALRYDLTVPFARYVVMNRNEITFPFKRYQIQPVWRADRPQKGRYREFYQCDADIVGTDSLLCEAEIVLMVHEVFKKLKIENFALKINNRKILSGITEIIGKPGCETDFCVAIDKLDKIGIEGVLKELREKDFDEKSIELLLPILHLQGNSKEKLEAMKGILKSSSTGLKGIEEISIVLEKVDLLGLQNSSLEFDLTLARGLSYYTGAIFEVKAIGVQIGSISGGGRYDNLTGVFGLPGVSGVGISFGVDRIYDVMEELNLFPEEHLNSTKILLCYFDEKGQQFGLPLLTKLRAECINSEIYPDVAKIKKQLDYANKKQVTYVGIIGDEEIKTGKVAVKNMVSGEQESLTIEEIITKLK